MLQTRTFSDYFGRAKSLLDEGFQFEANRKDALDLLNRAHECTERTVQDELLMTDHASRDQAWKDLYYGWAPLHVWKVKHSSLFVGKFPVQVQNAQAAVELRVAIKAAPILGRRKSPERVAAEAKRDAESKTCQVCGRSIFAEVGKIAHHGYQRPGHGVQTASCPGAMELPFETSKDRLELYVASLSENLKGMKKQRKAVSEEQRPVAIHYEVPRTEEGKPVYARGQRVYDRRDFTVTRRTLKAMIAAHPGYFSISRGLSNPTFDEVLATDLRRRDARIHEVAEHLAYQRKRLTSWTKTHEWTGKTWKAV